LGVSLDALLQGRRTWWAEESDCFDLLARVPDASVDAVVTDTIYAEVDRDYGRMSDADWRVYMQRLVFACLDVLTARGSAVFILQANQEYIGRTRPWLFWFMWWCAEELPHLTGGRIGMVQDAYWWNPAAAPTAHCNRNHGLMRPSVKPCVWIGPADCYRAQAEVLWSESAAQAERRATARLSTATQRRPSGHTMNETRTAAAAEERGGVTPFNLLPITNTNSRTSAGADGHGAGTPLELAEWWVRYLCPLGGRVLDPNGGTYTMGVAALAAGRTFLGCERMPEHHARGVARLARTRRL
jgi:hypothetical protein